MNRYLFFACIILLSVCAVAISNNRKLRADNKRQASNFEQINEDSQRELILRESEYEKLNTWYKNKLDSTIEANNIKLKHVKKATVAQIGYRDTSAVIPIESIPVLSVAGIDSIYTKQVNYFDGCWGMKGELISRDSESKFTITERQSTSDIQIIVTEKRRWIFWKKRQFNAFSDCGEIDITRIDFVKK